MPPSQWAAEPQPGEDDLQSILTVLFAHYRYTHVTFQPIGAGLLRLTCSVDIPGLNQQLQNSFSVVHPYSTFRYVSLREFFRLWRSRGVNFRGDDQWIRDLAAEGVEENPGPPPPEQWIMCNTRFMFMSLLEEFRAQLHDVRIVEAPEGSHTIRFYFLGQRGTRWVTSEWIVIPKSRAEWIRDLTREGVEPNPGPAYYDDDEKIEDLDAEPLNPDDYLPMPSYKQAKSEPTSAKDNPQVWQKKGGNAIVEKTPYKWKKVDPTKLRSLEELSDGVPDHSDYVCRICKNVGHIARNCPHKKNKNADKTCHGCHKVGHIRANCPNGERKGNKRGEKKQKYTSAEGQPVAAALKQVPPAINVTPACKRSIIVEGEDVNEMLAPAVEEGEDAIFPDESDDGKSERSEEDTPFVDIDDVPEPKPTRHIFRATATIAFLRRTTILLENGRERVSNRVSIPYIYQPFFLLCCLLVFSVFVAYGIVCAFVTDIATCLCASSDTYYTVPQVTQDTEDTYWDMEDKTSTKFLTRDFSSIADATSIKRDLIPIARSAKLHQKIKRNSPGLINRAYHNGRNQALVIRLFEARKKLKTKNFAFWFRQGYNFTFPVLPWLFKTAVEELNFLEPLDSYDHGLHSAGLFGSFFGFATRSVFIPIFEEVMRRSTLILFRRAARGIVGAATTSEYLEHSFILLIALLFVLRESKGNFSLRTTFDVFTRLSMHFMLGQVALFRNALCLHIVWNLASRTLSWGLALDSFSDLDDLFGLTYPDVCCKEQGLDTTPIQDQFKQVQGEKRCEPHFGARRFWGFSFAIPSVFRSCSCNEQVSITGRVGKKLPQHASQDVSDAVYRKWENTIHSTTPYFLRRIKQVRKPVNLQKWLASYPPKRRGDFLRAIERESDRVQLSAKSFIKREIAPKYAHAMKFKDPRFIQGCPVEMSLLTGPYLRKLAKNTREGLNGGLFSQDAHITADSIMRGDHIGYTCGLNSQQVGDMYTDAIIAVSSIVGPENVVILEDDQSRFDLHLTKGPFCFLNSVYSKKLPKRVSASLRRGLSKGTTSFGTKYQIPYTMQSGWPDTSIGDTLVNAAMKIEIHGLCRPWFSIICGDDSITVTSSQEIQRLGGPDNIITKYAEYGMEVEVKVTPDPIEAEFCSGRFYPLKNGRYVLMPKPGRFLSKILCDTEDRKPADQIVWLDSIRNVLENYGLVDPLCKALANALARQNPRPKDLTKKQKNIYSQSAYQREYNVVVARPEDADYMYYYSHVYDFSEKDVKELQQILENSQLYTYSSDLRFERMFYKDVGF